MLLNLEIATILAIYDNTLLSDLQALAVRFSDLPALGAIIRDTVRRFFEPTFAKTFCDMLDAMETWSSVMEKCDRWFLERGLKTHGDKGHEFKFLTANSDRPASYAPLDDMPMAMLYAQGWAIDPHAASDSSLERSFDILLFVIGETIAAAEQAPKDDSYIFSELLRSIASIYEAIASSPLKAIRDRREALVQFLLDLDKSKIPENKQWRKQSGFVFAELRALSLGYYVDSRRSNLIPPPAGFSGSFAEFAMLSSLALAAARNGLTMLVIDVINTIKALPPAQSDAKQVFGAVFDQLNPLQKARLEEEFPDFVSDETEPRSRDASSSGTGRRW